MDDDERLRALETRRDNIAHAIRNIDRDVAGAEDALARGEPPERLVAFLRDRNQDLRGHLQDLGRVEARIDDLKARDQDRARGPEEQKDAGRWDASQPATDADRAWYRRPQSPADIPAGRNNSDKPREWYAREPADNEPERSTDHHDRKRDR